MFRGVPGFLESVPGCSGFFTLFRVFLELLHAINKTLDIDVTVYLNSDVALCIKCYMSLVKYQKAEEHVQEIKTELKTAYSESGRRETATAHRR